MRVVVGESGAIRREVMLSCNGAENRGDVSGVMVTSRFLLE